MAKVVYNACYGGFGLSREACKRYWELQGKEVWIEDGKFETSFTVWLVPPKERVSQKEWSGMSIEERKDFNERYSKQTWYCRNVSRHDPILVQVVEELGAKANSSYANLTIQEVSGAYRIEKYDGYESVVESYDDWIVP